MCYNCKAETRRYTRLSRSFDFGPTVSLCNVLNRVSVELQNRVFCLKRILYSSAPTPTSPEGGWGYLLVGARESILFLAFAQVSSRTRLPSSLSFASHRLQGNKYFSSLDSLMISTLSRNQFALRNLLSCQTRTLVSSPGEREFHNKLTPNSKRQEVLLYFQTL